MQYTTEQLAAILERHKKWLRDEDGGSDADLSHANLSYANLSDADLRFANLSHANLSHADLSDADLSGANLSDANLSHANLSGADLSHANLRRANLSDANLSGADLSHANLRRANLSDANLSDANLRRANLSGANLRRANLSHADLSDANLIDANLRFANLSHANLSYADLSDADLRFANLSGADLSLANLIDANLSDANLSDADLRFANLSGAANLNLQIEDGLIQKIAIAVNADKKALEMGRWHTCDTTHCIAGWAVTLAKNGKELEEKYGTQIAGLMLLGVDAHSHFFDSNEDGKAYLNQFLPEESSMTLEELNTAIFDINKQYERDILKVKAAYAKSQELYKIGDIVTNGICTVWIKKIGWDLDYKGIPSPIYKGDNLTKKGTVNKVNPCASIYGNEGTKLT